MQDFGPPMSALGQKRTCAAQNGDVRFTPESGHVQRTSPCPLSANSGHRDPLFDHLVGTSEKHRRHGKVERTGSSEIEHELEA